MTTKREIPGLWWFPDKADEQWVGTLTLAPDESPHLQVTVKKPFSTKHETCPPVIHGCDQHGKPITLLFVTQPQSTSSAVLSHLTYSAGYAILGLHVPDATSFSVDSLIIKSQHLYEWSRITGFLHEKPETTRDIYIHYRRPSDQTFEIDSNLSVELRATCLSHTNLSERDVSEGLCVAFISKQPLSLAKCTDLITAIRHLLHFAVLSPVYPLEITANKNGYGYNVGDTFFPKEIEIISGIIREPVKSEILPERWVFQLNDVQADFGKFMAKWLTYLETFDEALGCYSTTVYHGLPHSVEHLCLTQGLDAYHGIKFQSHKDQDFKKKLKELIEPHETPLKGLVDDGEDFATTVHANRNYYTHHNPKWKEGGRVVSGGNLFRLNEKLSLLFQMCVLTDMGIPSDRFSRLRRQLATQIIDYV